MALEDKNPNPQNLSELDPEQQVDPLTDTKTVAQQPTPEEQIHELPATKVNGLESRTGNYDETTGAAHPAEDSGADKGVDRSE